MADLWEGLVPTEMCQFKMDCIVRGREMFPQMTYEKIGKVLGLSRERVRQLHQRALKIEAAREEA